MERFLISQAQPLRHAMGRLLTEADEDRNWEPVCTHFLE